MWGRKKLYHATWRGGTDHGGMGNTWRVKDGGDGTRVGLVCKMAVKKFDLHEDCR